MARSTQDNSAYFPKTHDHAHCVDRAIERAIELCDMRGVRLTPLRRRVLELVWRSHRPVGAYEILELLGRERQRAAPPTVYRSLDFLLEQGLIHRIERLNAFVGCRMPEQDHSGQFMICKTCGVAAELSDTGIDEAIRSSAIASGFTVDQRTLEMEGTCPNCEGIK